MARKSAISQMPDAIQDAVHAAIREGRATIDEITEMIRHMGGQVSRSAVGNYVKKANEALERHRRMALVAKQFADNMEAFGDQAQMARQIISSKINEIVSGFTFGPDGELIVDAHSDIDIKELSVAARTLRDVAASAKIDAEARAKIRQEVAEEMADLANQVQSSDGTIDAERLRELIRNSYGV